MPTVAEQIKVLIEEYSCNPQENDLGKVVAEIIEIATKEIVAACNSFICNIDFVKGEDDSRGLLKVLTDNIEKAVEALEGRE